MFKCRNNAVLLVAALLISGCASLKDPAAERLNHTNTFRAELNDKCAGELKAPLGLVKCLEIALRENYSVKQADLNLKLAGLDKDMAFANFLPGVDISASLTTWSRQSMAMGAFTQDKTYRNAGISGTMPILMPSVWFMYANRKMGVSVSKISAHYVRQTMVLDVTVAFFNCLMAEDTIATLETQLGAAKSQYERVNGLAKEGFAAGWERDQAFYQFKARETELAIARRSLDVNKAKLLETMGLSPLAKISLDRSDIDFQMPQDSLETLVLTALEKNPSLSIADHSIVMNENAVRSAITEFLPTLSGFVNGTWTSDSIAAYTHNVYGGFSGAWDIFSGFANMAGYKAAKVRKESSMLDREATFLAVILEVVKAQATLRDVVEGLNLAEIAYNTAKAKYLEYEGKQKEGLIPLNDMLDAQADMDKAQASFSEMKYQRHLALAALKMAMGTIGDGLLEK